MLAIRMQRTGRKGHAQFRVIVQDSRRSPKSGSVVALLGNHDPHSKTTNIEKDKAAFYLDHGAQPSARVASLLKTEGVKLPDWVKLETKKKREIRNPEKLRKNRSQEPESVEAAAEPEVKEEPEVASQESVEEPAVEETPSEPTATKEKAEEPAETTAEQSEEA